MPFVALAHTGVSATHGFYHGLTHPLMGIDHLLAMVGIGIWAAQLQGKKRWVVPAVFVAVMMLGGAMGMTQIPFPMVEFGIAASVFVVGALIMLEVKVSTLSAAVLAAVFALFHGYEHGAELPLAASAVIYTAGFVLSTALLHVAGIGIAAGARHAFQTKAIRYAGAATMVAGIVLLIA